MSRTTVVYLSGFGRSGSTLVERILGAQTGWVNVGETLWTSRGRSPARTPSAGTRGEPFSRCPLWTRVGEVAFGGWTADVLDRLASAQRSAARQRHLPGLLAPRRSPSGALVGLRNAYAAIYRAVAEVTGSSVVVDASKGPALGAALAGAGDVDLRMLNLVRDPRAVAWSWHRRVERPHATSGTDQMWRIPLHRSAAQWSALQVEVEAIAYAGRVPVARIRYEDLVAAPVRTLVTAIASAGRAPGSWGPAGGRWRGAPAAEPRTVRQPRTVPLRAGAVAARRPMGHRDAGVVPRPRHGAHAPPPDDIPLPARHPHDRSGPRAGRPSILEQLMTHPRLAAARPLHEVVRLESLFGIPADLPADEHCRPARGDAVRVALRRRPSRRLQQLHRMAFARRFSNFTGCPSLGDSATSSDILQLAALQRVHRMSFNV